MSAAFAAVPIRFVVPKESERRGFARFEGDGEAIDLDGVLVLRGKVFRLTAWWLKLGAPLLFLVTAGLFAAFRDPGLYIGLGAIGLLVAADFYQQYAGRAYELTVPSGVSRSVVPGNERWHVALQLDAFVVGDGRRPPLIEFEIDAARVASIQRLLLS